LTPFVDCHTHLDQFGDAEVPDILERARAVGVTSVIAAGTTLDSSARCVELARRHPGLYAGVGIHPADLTGPVDDEVYGRLRDLAASSPRVVVISETGLDFLETSPDRALQEEAFRRQIRLARELGLPVVFHSRGAHGETLRVLREEGIREVGGVFHYFQGHEATAHEAMEMGIYISLARPLLRLPELQEVARRLPLESVVLESDSYPQPFKRHRRNWTEPRHVADVAAKLAELKGVTVEEVADVTTRNLVALTRGRLDPFITPGS